jgi:hypothetical protein
MTGLLTHEHTFEYSAPSSAVPALRGVGKVDREPDYAILTA